MNMAEKIDTIKSSGYVFKVLSGSMNGIEFSLGSHSYFMCVGDTVDEQENLARNLEYAERTLYLPTATPGHNFVVNLADQVTEEEFVVTVSNPDHQETLNFTFNVICHVEGIYFALKREGEAWSQDVLKGTLPTVTKTEPEAIAKQTVTRSSKWKYRWILTAILAVSLGGVGGAMAWLQYGAAPGPDSAAMMLRQLGHNAGYSAQRGRDHTYYLFAQNNQLAEWAHRSIARTQSTESWKILTPQEEETRLARILNRENIAFFTLRLNDIHAPTLVISSTRNATDSAALKHIKTVLMDAIPYAGKVNIELKDDQDVLRMAEEGLVALGFDYQMKRSGSGVTLSSAMPSGDSRMAEFNRFVSQFYRLWGRHYVHFSVDLRDDALKEKSFKYGQDGYVKMGKSHWLFNS